MIHQTEALDDPLLRLIEWHTTASFDEAEPVDSATSAEPGRDART